MAANFEFANSIRVFSPGETIGGGAFCDFGSVPLIASHNGRQRRAWSWPAASAPGHFLASLTIATTSRTTTKVAITGQTHVPPLPQPSIHPLLWFIIKKLRSHCDWRRNADSGLGSGRRCRLVIEMPIRPHASLRSAEARERGAFFSWRRYVSRHSDRNTAPLSPHFGGKTAHILRAGGLRLSSTRHYLPRRTRWG